MKLTISLADQLRAFAEYLQKTGAELFEEAYKVQGMRKLSIQQLRYLEVIDTAPGITPGELTARFGVAKPTVSSVIRQLEKAGLIVREKGGKDARVSRLQPSPRAHAVFEMRRGMYGKLARHIQGRLDRTKVELLAALMDEVVKGGLGNG